MPNLLPPAVPAPRLQRVTLPPLAASFLSWRATIRSKVLTSSLFSSLSLSTFASLFLFVLSTCIQFLTGSIARTRFFSSTRASSRTEVSNRRIRRSPLPFAFYSLFLEVTRFVFVARRRFAPSCLFSTPLLFIPLSRSLSLSISFTSVFTPGKTDDRFSRMNGVQRDVIIQSFSVDPRVGECRSERGRRAERDGGRT